jgi:hypothetical protein
MALAEEKRVSGRFAGTGEGRWRFALAAQPITARTASVQSHIQWEGSLGVEGPTWALSGALSRNTPSAS